ncbi:MAG: LysR family transcriptional regulator [Bradyrhizobium sp.]|nr:LysR family transcriptional regulator [Bradyrhizobium sp.]
MSAYDLNLLTSLHALLSEGSVAGAARRLHLSNSAMSRTLSRIRETFDDPILVRAGRSLVPTPRAIELRDRVSFLMDETQAILRNSSALDLSALERIFVIRANEGFIVEFGGALLRRLSGEAPRVGLRFAVKAEKDPRALREAQVDLDVGVLGETGPEIRMQALLRDRFVGVTALGHPLAAGPITAERYAAQRHISVSRRGLAHGPIDEALRAKGLKREVAAVVPSFPGALALARQTDFVANVPERQTAAARAGLFTFPLPLPTEEVVVSMMWHPRLDADPAHRWLRSCVRSACTG